MVAPSPSKGLRNLDAEQPLLAQFRERLAGKARLGVDRRGVGLGHLGRRTGARGQVALASTGIARYRVFDESPLTIPESSLKFWQTGRLCGDCPARTTTRRRHILSLSDARLSFSKDM